MRAFQYEVRTQPKGEWGSVLEILQGPQILLGIMSYSGHKLAGELITDKKKHTSSPHIFKLAPTKKCFLDMTGILSKPGDAGKKKKEEKKLPEKPFEVLCKL